jgi:asparagine synthase (glutamine-hydrolysing)
MFGGVVLLQGEWPVARPVRTAMAAPFAVFGAADAEGYAEADAAVLYERRRFVAATDRDTELPRRDPATGTWIAFWGRIDNRTELGRLVGLDAGEIERSTDAGLIAAAWPRLGRDLPSKLVGDFALAVVDPERRSVFLARDPMGVKPLYYRLDNGIFAFASTAAALKLAGLPLTPDRGWIARYLWSGLSADPERTAYAEMRKLPGGHRLSIEGGGAPQVERWHHWRDDQAAASRRDPKWVAAYRAALEEAVFCRMPSDFPVGVETSGGIDSSTLLAYAARLLGDPGDRLRAYGMAMSEEEPDFILATSQLYRVRHNYICSALSVDQEDHTRTLAAIGYPEEHGNATGHTPFYRDAARHRVRTLFSGFGGDEVVTNPGFHALYEMAGNRNYRALLEMMRGNAVARPLRMAKLLLRPSNPVPYRPGFLQAWRRRWPHCVLSDAVIEEFGIEQAYFETARFDGPYTRVNDFILDHHLAEMRVTTRLENCTLAAAAWGIDYRWPLWDVRLVQQYLSTPAIEKFGPGGMGRYLHRRAIHGVVPAKVAWKPSKDMGMPVGGLDGVAPAAGAAAAARERIPAEVAAVIDPAKLDRELALLEENPSRETRTTIGSTVRALGRLSLWLEG